MIGKLKVHKNIHKKITENATQIETNLEEINPWLFMHSLSANSN